MKENKRLLLIIGGAILLIIIIVLFTRGKKDEQTAVETNNIEQQNMIIKGDKLAEVKSYKGLEVSNVQVKIQNSMTEITADVHNNTSQDMKEQWVNINVLDKEGNRITSMGGFVSDIKAGESTELYTTIPSNGAGDKAYNIEITEEREPINTERPVDPEATNPENSNTGDNQNSEPITSEQ